MVILVPSVNLLLIKAVRCKVLKRQGLIIMITHFHTLISHGAITPLKQPIGYPTIVWRE